MAVVGLPQLIDEGRGGGFAFTDSRNEHRYTRTYLVRVDSPLDNEYAVCNAPGIPRGRTVFSENGWTDLLARVQNVTPKQDKDDPYTWRVTVEWGTPQANAPTSQQQQQTENTDPTHPSLPIVNYSTRSRRVALEEDWSTPPQAYVNSAGEPFDPPEEVDVFNLVISITRNMADFDADDAWNCIGGCNAAQFTIRGKPFGYYVLRITNWTGTQQQNDQGIYYQHNIELEAQYPDWKSHKLNAGMSAIVSGGSPSTNKADVAKDRFGLAQSRPVKLDANGVELAPGAAPTYKTFLDFFEVDFTTLAVLQGL